jgi:anti-anti-sigma factor
MSATKTPAIRIQNGVTVVSLGSAYENLDETHLDYLRETLMGFAEAADPPLLILDLSQTKFFGSAFIELLFRLSNRLKARGGKFAISGLTSYCAEVLSITHLDKLWPIFPASEAAVKALEVAKT